MKGQWYKRLWPWIIVSVAAHLILIGTVNRPVGTIDTADAFYEVTLLYREPVPIPQEASTPAGPTPPTEALRRVEAEETPGIEAVEDREDDMLSGPKEAAEIAKQETQTNAPVDLGPDGQVENTVQQGRKETAPPDVTPVIEGLKRRIEEALTYPYVARKRGLQGVVRLALRLDERGNLIELEVTESSGYGVLDNAATQLVEKVVPYPHGLGIPLSVDIPIRYSLVN